MSNKQLNPVSHKAMVLCTSSHPFGTLNPFPVGAENKNTKKKMKIHVEMWQQKKNVKEVQGEEVQVLNPLTLKMQLS